MNPKHYQGNPCKYGHSGIRWKSTRYCVVCNYEKSKRWNESKNGTTYHRDRHIFNKYRLTSGQVDELLGKQGGRCAICRHEIETTNDRGRFSVCVDHDHSTGRVRGLLCNHCNRGLGMFLDNTEYLQNAIEYLERLQVGNKGDT